MLSAKQECSRNVCKRKFHLEIDTDNLKSQSLKENWYGEAKRKPGKGPFLVIGNRASGHPDVAIGHGRANFRTNIISFTSNHCGIYMVLG